MNTRSKSYIFRWKEDGICVFPSRSKSRQAVWEWAFHNLRRAGEELTPQVEQRIRDRGEVVIDDE